jgi:phosphoglycolate phosphatase-like HAD superfamily hydrolase
MEWHSKIRPAEPVSAVLFDFDGTISALRCGWENVMESFMTELIEASAGGTGSVGRTGSSENTGGAKLPGWEPGGGLCGAPKGRAGGRPGRGLSDRAGGGVREMVRRYIDESAGVQTIFQMKWLVEQVQAHSAARVCDDATSGCDAAIRVCGAAANSGDSGANGGDGSHARSRLPPVGSGSAEKTGGTAANCDAAMLKSGGAAVKAVVAATAPSPWECKAEYNRRLMVSVAERRRRLRDGAARPEDYMIKGSRELLEMLADRGVALYVASGTDDADVKLEVAALGLADFFREIRGAPEGREDCSKEAAIRELLGRKGVEGSRLAVVGDGKVEIAIGRENGARTLGVASDERALAGVNPVKRARLLKAGADAIVGDFADAAALEEFFFGGGYTGER